MISITYFTTNYINYLYHYCNIPVTTINDYEIYCFNNSLTSGVVWAWCEGRRVEVFCEMDALIS